MGNGSRAAACFVIDNKSAQKVMALGMQIEADVLTRVLARHKPVQQLDLNI